MGLRWPVPSMRPRAPCRSFTSVQMLRTHTHTPGRSRVNPERQEEEKNRTQTTGRRPKTAQGREGNKRTSRINLHSETDLTSTGHITEGHGGDQGPNGGLVCDEKETNNIKLRELSSLLSNRALLPKRDRGRSSHMGINGCSSSSELDARNV